MDPKLQQPTAEQPILQQTEIGNVRLQRTRYRKERDHAFIIARTVGRCTGYADLKSELERALQAATQTPRVPKIQQTQPEVCNIGVFVRIHAGVHGSLEFYG
jgi:hypothetical protein